MLKIDLQLFGGRGASSAGAGGNISVNVANSTSLISERERNQKEVDQTLAAFKDVNEEYGYIIEDINLVTLQGKGAKSVIAYYDSNDKTISTNKYFFNAAKMDAAYDECVRQGFHPGRGNKSGTEAVAFHELGHALTDAYAAKNGISSFEGAAGSIVSAAASKLGKGATSKSIGAKISGYAKKNASETIAEAFADVKCNGSKAKAESKAVVDVLNTGLK